MVVGCLVCDAILDLYSKPIGDNAWFDVGEIDNVLSGTCHNHEDLISECIGDWRKHGEDGMQVVIFKFAGDSCLKVFIHNTLFPKAFELIQESKITDSRSRHISKPSDHTVNL